LEDINQRRRIRFMAAGMAVSLFAAMTNIFLKSPGFYLGSIWFAALETPLQLLAASFPLSFAYAVLRHRLFDIRVMIRLGLQYALARGALLSLVPVLVAAMFGDALFHGEQPLLEILRARGWVYGGLGILALLAHARRRQWFSALDRRFFREHYDGQLLLREIAEEARQAGNLERAAPRVVARVEAALHPRFAAVMVRPPDEASFRALASAPSGHAPPLLSAETRLMGLVRILGKPLEMPHSESGWLERQLPHEETEFLRLAEIDLIVPIAVTPHPTEALMALGVKRSEEPYTREDQDLLSAIAASLAGLLQKPVEVPARVSEAFEECPQCGVCYDTGAGRCTQEGSSLDSIRLPRQLVGRYRLERRRGRGGMGTVYEATDTALDRRVAVKVIREDLVGSRKAAERFRLEARATASFAHPNVVTVFDFGVAADTCAFLVMEILNGSTLRGELLQKKRLSAARTLEILSGVCAAVDAAHRRKLIHRDLKPENVFLARNESGEIVKVLDFGIAKFLPTATDPTALTAATADTGRGLLVGTLPYMSPEQVRDEPVQPAWDIWALAVIAYEMLTGGRPFSGGAMLSGRLTPVLTYLPNAPASWQTFFDLALALDPSSRPRSATIFLSELKQALS
jgi:tRNA A-37 threonylcarbamoyl transferase component Bud32